MLAALHSCDIAPLRLGRRPERPSPFPRAIVCSILDAVAKPRFDSGAKPIARLRRPVRRG